MRLRRLLAAALCALLACDPARAAQNSIVTPGPPLPMTGLATFLNAALNAAASNWSGPAAPSASGLPVTYQTWMDTSTTLPTLRLLDLGGVWVPVGTLNNSTHQFFINIPNVPVFRSTIALDQRTGVADAPYTMAAGDYLIVYTSLTQNRNVSLLAASSLNPGRKLIIEDASGSATASKTISAVPNGTDTINGANATTVAINLANGRAVLETDGVSGWTLGQMPTALAGNTQLPSIPAGSMLGNNTGGSSTPLNLTVAQVQSMWGLGQTGTAIAPWAAQVHQNGGCGGGTNIGAALMWANCDFNRQADYDSLYSYDQSILTTYTVGGSKTTNDLVGFQFTINSSNYTVQYTVQAGDTLTTIASGLAACLNSNAANCTGSTAFVNAMLAFHGADGYGYKASAGSVGTKINFDFPWASSGNAIATALSGGATETLSAAANNQTDNGPYLSIARYISGRTPVVGDQYGSIFFQSWASAASTGIDTQLAHIGVQLAAQSATNPQGTLYIATANSGSGKIAYNNLFVGPGGVFMADTTGNGAACQGGDPGAGWIRGCGGLIINNSSVNANSAAMVDIGGVIRATGTSASPTTGAGIELEYSGTTGQLVAIDRGSATYRAMQLLGASIEVVPNANTTYGWKFDTTGLWPDTDNSVSIGKASFAVSAVYSKSWIWPNSTQHAIPILEATSGWNQLSSNVNNQVLVAQNLADPIFTNMNQLVLAGTGISVSGSQVVTFASNDVEHVTFAPGPQTSLNGNTINYQKISKASTVDNLIGSAYAFTCSVNPTISVYECGTSATCSSATLIGSVTLTGGNTAFASSLISSSIGAGDYIGWGFSGGTCTSLNAWATMQIHQN